MNRRKWIGAAAAVASAPLSRSAWAHPVHTSLTEAHHRPQRHLLELSLRARPEDMQAALRAQGRPEVQIDALPGDQLDRLCAVYLRERFIVCDRQPRRLPLVVLGHELDARWLWVHFEFPVGDAADLRGFHIDARVFFEVVPSQTNTVLLRHAQRLETLTFRAPGVGTRVPAP